MRLWDAATQRERDRRSGHGDEVLALACSPTGDLIASAGKDLSVRLWRAREDAGAGTRVTVLRGHKAEIKALAFTPDGRTLASSSTDLTVKLWHTPTWVPYDRWCATPTCWRS